MHASFHTERILYEYHDDTVGYTTPVSGIRYQVSGIRYQVSGIGYRVSEQSGSPVSDTPAIIE